MNRPHLNEEENRQELLPRDALLAEVVRRLVEAYKPERIYLFGSKHVVTRDLTATTTCWSSFPMMLRLSVSAAGWPMRSSEAQARSLTCSCAPAPTSSLAAR